MRSLQRRFILTSGAVLLVCALLAGLGGYRSAVKEANEILDSQLAQLVKTLLFLVASDGGNVVGDIGLGQQGNHAMMVFQIWRLKGSGDRFDQSGRLLIQRGSDRPYPQLVLRSGEMDSGLMTNRKDGFSMAQWSGHTFRICAQTSANGEFRVLVGQDMIDRREIIESIAWSNTRPYLFILPLGMLALAWVAYRGLAPIRRLTTEVSSRDPANLDHFGLEDAPLELRPLLQALNMLLDRLHSAMDNERRFTGDAAHELRNPIAALRAQLDALRLADNKDTRIKAQVNASATAARLSRLVNQLLTLARLDAYSGGTGSHFDLAELVRESCGEVARAARSKGVDISMHSETAILFGEEDAFRILLRNLLENALRYTPSGGRIEVRVINDGRQVDLMIADNGPGVPAAEIGQLGQRFHRVNASDTAGVGLGLSIVCRIAEHYHGVVRFGGGVDGRGFGVTIRFPCPPG